MFVFLIDIEFWYLFAQSAYDLFSKTEFWSAIAAFGSAFAAYMSWSAQVKTLHHTFRPDIIPTDWRREAAADGKSEKLYFSRICNHGRDTAHLVRISANKILRDRHPQYLMGDVWNMNLWANYEIHSVGCIRIFWDNVPANDGLSRLLHLDVTAWFKDALDICHTTVFSIVVFQDENTQFQGGPCIAPGVYMVQRMTTSIAAKEAANPNLLNRVWHHVKSRIPKRSATQAA